jgi:glycosyltransferase involved in cell wall biosynthesis
VKPRLALVGAFPFPVPQGSQVYFADQARALRALGAEVTLFVYGRGAGPLPADLNVVVAPAALSPRRLRAGPSLLKPLADAALARRLASEAGRRPFDALLAHNAEAALLGLAARARIGAPVVYVAHALWRQELPAYGPTTAAGLLARAGAALDRGLARRCDALLTLCASARDALEPLARGPVALIPPGLAPGPPPDPESLGAACARHGLKPGRFALYAGNLDAYQSLPVLAGAACRAPGIPFVVATHDARGAAPEPLRIVETQSPAEVRALTWAAGVCLLPRAIPGGFPIKLLNYMEAGRPIIALHSVADGFEDGRSALLLADGAGDTAWAEAVTRVMNDAALARRLGEGARALLLRRHAWPALASATLDLVARARQAAAP